MICIPTPIEIYQHTYAKPPQYGIRLDLGIRRLDFDGHSYVELGEACATAVMRMVRDGGRMSRATPITLALDFVVRDRKVGFGVRPEDTTVIRRFGVVMTSATYQIVEVEPAEPLPV